MRTLKQILSEGRNAKPKGIFVSDDVQVPFPNDTMTYIQKAINIRSKEVDKDWKSAIDLVDFCLNDLNVPKPMAHMRERWKQYHEMISYAVKNLADSRGLDADWNPVR